MNCLKRGTCMALMSISLHASDGIQGMPADNSDPAHLKETIIQQQNYIADLEEATRMATSFSSQAHKDNEQLLQKMKAIQTINQRLLQELYIAQDLCRAQAQLSQLQQRNFALKIQWYEGNLSLARAFDFCVAVGCLYFAYCRF